ncbi:unnamed protein product [Prunus armeniaca]
MVEVMVVCDGMRRFGLAMGCDGSVSEMGCAMGLDLQRWVVRWGLQRWVVRWLCFKGDEVCSGDGVCLKGKGVFDWCCMIWDGVYTWGVKRLWGVKSK